MDQEEMDRVCAAIVALIEGAQHEEGNTVYCNIEGFDIALVVEPM